MYIEPLPDCGGFPTPDPLDSMLNVQDGHIVIRTDYIIVIPLNQCTTVYKIHDWVTMLRKMKWMERDVLERFVELALKENWSLIEKQP